MLDPIALPRRPRTLEMAIEPVGPGHDGFYTRWVWVQVEIFTHGFAGMGPYEVAGWI
jgi:hypothetical protein